MTFAVPSDAEDSCLKNHSSNNRNPRLAQLVEIEGKDSQNKEEKEELRNKGQNCPASESGGISPTQPVSAAGSDTREKFLYSSPVSGDDDNNGSEPPPDNFPEGGLEAWLVVFGSFCAMMIVFGLINTAAVFESWFSTHQLADRSASDIGWIFSLYLFVVFFVGIQVGPLFDAYGARYLVSIGSALVVASLMLLSICESKSCYYSTLRCRK